VAEDGRHSARQHHQRDGEMNVMSMMEEIGPQKPVHPFFKWTDARTKRLIKLYADGLSYAQVAEEIGEGCTRLRVRGKVRRLKLQQPKRQREIFEQKPPIPPPPEPEVEPLSEHSCTITGLSNRTCRYPLWDFHGKPSERFYCGRPADLSAGRPYCERHEKLCVGPVPARTRR